MHAAPDRRRETDYLHWFAPNIADYCHVISFRLSVDGEWMRRRTIGYRDLLDLPG